MSGVTSGAALTSSRMSLRSSGYELLRHNHLSGKSVKTCPALFAKIFRLTCNPNQSHNSACLTADEGRWPSSRRRGEMRWTRELRLTSVADAYGEVVWFGRRGAGAKSAKA